MITPKVKLRFLGLSEQLKGNIFPARNLHRRVGYIFLRRLSNNIRRIIFFSFRRNSPECSQNQFSRLIQPIFYNEIRSRKFHHFAASITRRRLNLRKSNKLYLLSLQCCYSLSSIQFNNLTMHNNSFTS